MNKPPCKDCPNRVLNCHSTCKDYKLYREQIEQAHINQRNYTMSARAPWDTHAKKHVSNILRKDKWHGTN